MTLLFKFFISKSFRNGAKSAMQVIGKDPREKKYFMICQNSYITVCETKKKKVTKMLFYIVQITYSTIAWYEYLLMVVYIILSLYPLDLNNETDIAFLTNNNNRKFGQENKIVLFDLQYL